MTQIRRVSVSMLGSFQKCQEQYRRIYLEGHRCPPGIAAFVGRGVHGAAEMNFKRKLITGKDEPLDVCLDAARDKYVKDMDKDGVFIPLEQKPETKTLIAEGLDNTIKSTRAAHDLVFPRLFPDLIEAWLEMNDPELPVPVVGVLDAFESKKNHIPDLKRAGKKWSEGRVLGDHQSAVYVELIKARNKGPAPTFSFEVVGNNKSGGWNQSIPATVLPGDYAAFVQRSKLMLQSTAAGIFNPCEPGHWLCSPKWCGFFWTCPFIPAHRKIIPKGGKK